MKYSLKLLWVMAFATILLMAGNIVAEKIKIEKLDDLPRHTYKVEIKATEFLENDAALLDLAAQLKADLMDDLEKYDIADKTTLKDYYASLGVISQLEGRWDDYLRFLELQKELEDKESSKLTKGLFSQVYAKMRRNDPVEKEPYLRSEFAALVNGLPYEVVAEDIKGIKAQAEIISSTLISGSLDATIQPVLDGGDGTVSKDIAKGLVNSGYIVRHFLPNLHIVREVLTEYLAAHKVEKEDIWAAREVILTQEDPKGKPVTVAIWDSGLDTEIYGKTGQLWINEDEIPENGIDDDKNGYVDDAHGIAYDLHSNKIAELLKPLKSEEDVPRWQRLYKGITDLQSNIESDEATEFKQAIGSLNKDEVGPFIEEINLYGHHAHGTHVGGIAARNNPFVRLMASRITFDYRLIPETPTIDQARKDSAATMEVLQYYKDNGVRVVNMSWGGSIASVEDALEQNNAGGTPEERKELARQIFEISKAALYEGIKSTPEILYITSAGNADNDVTFEEFIPSTFDLPNIMSVGAVDQAGDETDFTSFGKVDVYANGFEVESYVPGGIKMPMSGTSMSSPNVTNLAAKILTLRPDLTSTQVRELIEKACDEHQAGERVVKLINPKKSMELLASMKEMGKLEN